MTARTFAEVHKDATTNSVHVATAIGNERPRRRFRPVITTKRALPPGTRNLKAMDSQRSHVPFRWNSGAMATMRPDQIPRFLGALTDSDRLEQRELPLDSLTAMQNRVDTGKAKAWADGSIKSDRLPVVVRANGENLIADGHHRLAGAWLRGDQTARVRFKDLEPVSNTMKRDEAATWSVPLDVQKMVPDQQLIFGWASVVEKNGVLIIDKQGDIITPETLEDAAYDFVLHSASKATCTIRWVLAAWSKAWCSRSRSSRPWASISAWSGGGPGSRWIARRYGRRTARASGRNSPSEATPFRCWRSGDRNIGTMTGSAAAGTERMRHAPHADEAPHPRGQQR